MKLRRIQLTALSALTLLATSAATVVTTSPAMAAGCYTSLVNDRTAKGYCTGTKSYQVYVRCEENSGHEYTAAGSLAWGGTDSYATCHEYAWVIDRWMIQL
ncbi:hypothetical protein J3R08_001451 [Micromonospora sp. HB375]|nr:hypothetical protein [Micromonospora sp. HB375]MDH6466725.1 hypothetical protein [Micromonospora sp. H404/HB375]